MQKPTEYLNWTTGQASQVLAPPSNLRVNGWGVGIRPPAQYTNWQIWLLDQWVQYLDQITNTGSPNQVIRLINGGEWQFVSNTGILSWSQDAHLSIPGISDSNNIIPAGLAALNDGDIAYAVVNPPIIVLGDISNGSNIVSNVNFTGNLVAGMQWTGLGIPTGTTIFAVGSSTLTLSQNATSDLTQNQMIGCLTGSLSVIVSPEESFIPNLTTILIAKRLGKEIYLGVNSTQMVIRDHEFKPFMGSGYFDTYEAVAGENLIAGQTVYISSGSVDGGRVSGEVYKLDVSSSFKDTRGIYAGTVISDTISGASATIVYNGFYRYSGLIAGQLYFADPSNAGGITSVKPSLSGDKIVPIGFATTTTSLIISGTGSQLNDFSQPTMKAELLGVGDGSTTIFNLSDYPFNNDSLFLFQNGRISTKTEYVLSGKQVTFPSAISQAVEIYAQYPVAAQNFIQGFQEAPTLVSGSTYSISGQPSNKDSLFVFVDGVLLEKTEYTLVIGTISGQIILNSALVAGQDIYCFYLSPVGFSNAASPAITNMQNIGTGTGVFASILSGIAKLKSIKAGAGASISDDGSTITISAPAVGGGYSVIGAKLSPSIIDPAVGVGVSSSQRVLRFVTASTPESVVTANPQIVAGNIIGQEQVLVGTDDTNYPVFNDGNGLSLNGTARLTSNEALSLFWDGYVWCEIGRRL